MEINLFKSYLKDDKKYNKLCTQLEKLTVDLYKKFKDTDIYKLLDNEEKIKLEEIVGTSKI